MDTEKDWNQPSMGILEQAYIRDRYIDAIQNIKYDKNKFVNKGYYMK